MSLELTRHPVTCPVCDHPFTVVTTGGDETVVRVDSDFMPHHEGVNPLHHEVRVCPECGFAALPADWLPLPSAEQLEWLVGELSGGDHRRFDFAQGERTAFAALLSFQLALKAYQLRKASSGKLAALHHRMAWIFRQGHDVRRETQALTRAVATYEEAFNQQNLFEREDQPERTAYLVGELNRRLGRLEEATSWFERAIALDSALGETARSCRQQLLAVDEVRRYEAMLARVEVFEPLSPSERSLLATLAEPGRHSGTRVVCEQNAPGTSMFVVVTGEARVEVDGQPVASLGPGQVFGEMSLLTGRRRSATVTSSGLLEVLEIKRPAFKAILQANPETADRIGDLVARRQAEREALVEARDAAGPGVSAVERFREVFELS